MWTWQHFRDAPYNFHTMKAVTAAQLMLYTCPKRLRDVSLSDGMLRPCIVVTITRQPYGSVDIMQENLAVED